MLGEKISDPLHTESDNDSVKGLGFLPMETTFVEKNSLHKLKQNVFLGNF